jgi:alpha-L-fucosidase
VTVTNTFPVITAITQDANTVLVTGSGFPANTEATVDLHSTPVVLGTLTADANGAFSKAFTIPCSVEAGSHTVTATAATGQTASTGIQVGVCATPKFTG